MILLRPKRFVIIFVGCLLENRSGREAIHQEEMESILDLAEIREFQQINFKSPTFRLLILFSTQFVFEGQAQRSGGSRLIFIPNQMYDEFVSEILNWTRVIPNNCWI